MDSALATVMPTSPHCFRRILELKEAGGKMSKCSQDVFACSICAV